MSQAQCVRSLDGFVFTWPDLPFEVSLSRIRESRSSTSSELQVKYVNGSGKPKTLTHQTFNLLTSKLKLAKELTARHEAPWLTMLEQVCIISLRYLRQGEPIESLLPTSEDHPAWFVLNPLLFDKNPTILYGPGDSLKSFFVLYCGLLLASGLAVPSLAVSPEPRRVLFLDWEMSVQDVRGRVKMLQAGDPRLTGVPDYRRCYQPLADEVSELKKVVSEGCYDVLIIDSLAMAAGGQELERADSAIRFNAALRALNCTSLIVGHTPKPQEDQKERHLYGSVFFSNLGRNSWECRREGQTIGLYHKKHNLSAQHDPLGFTLDMTQDTCTITEANLADDPVLSSGLPIQDRLASELTAHPGQTIKELALALNEKGPSVKAKLYLYKSRFISIEGKWECLA
jgi:AAA domain-containing protein